ncbi:hypothetical protein C5167_047725, partial [Papaver somniferum]
REVAAIESGVELRLKLGISFILILCKLSASQVEIPLAPRMDFFNMNITTEIISPLT